MSKRRSNVGIYLLLANGTTWLLWGFSMAISQSKDYLMPAPGNIIALLQNGFQNSEHIIYSSLFALANFGPLFATTYAIRIERGAKGLADLWKNIFSFKVEGKWVLRAIVISFLVSAIPFLMAVMTGLIPDPVSVMSFMLPYILPVFVWQLLTSGLGEEPGWRGYLLRKLQGRFEGNKPIWVLGLIWAVWHYPFTIYWTVISMAGEESGAVITTLIMALAGFTINIIGTTYLHVWHNLFTCLVLQQHWQYLSGDHFPRFQQCFSHDPIHRERSAIGNCGRIYALGNCLLSGTSFGQGTLPRLDNGKERYP